VKDYLLYVEEASPYAVHRAVYEALGASARPLYRHEPKMNAAVVRSDRPIEDGLELRRIDWAAADCLMIELRAALMAKRNAKRFFVPSADRHYREQWLNKRGRQAGFIVDAVDVTAQRDEIDKPGEPFGLDRTDFRIVATVADEGRFAYALRQGIGPVGRAFGRGLILITRNLSRED